MTVLYWINYLDYLCRHLSLFSNDNLSAVLKLYSSTADRFIVHVMVHVMKNAVEATPRHR